MSMFFNWVDWNYHLDYQETPILQDAVIYKQFNSFPQRKSSMKVFCIFLIQQNPNIGAHLSPNFFDDYTGDRSKIRLKRTVFHISEQKKHPPFSCSEHPNLIKDSNKNPSILEDFGFSSMAGLHDIQNMSPRWSPWDAFLGPLRFLPHLRCVAGRWKAAVKMGAARFSLDCWASRKTHRTSIGGGVNFPSRKSGVFPLFGWFPNMMILLRGKKHQ